MRQMGMMAAAMMAAALVRGGEIKHRFLVSDFLHGSVHYVDQTDASKNWTLKLPEIAFDLHLIGGNRLLCNRSKGYDVYDLATRQKVDAFQSDAITDTVRSVRRRADGRTFMGTQGGAVYEFDVQKKLVATYGMPKAAKYVRLMRFTPNTAPSFTSPGPRRPAPPAPCGNSACQKRTGRPEEHSMCRSTT